MRRFEEFNRQSNLFLHTALGGVLHGRFDMGVDYSGNFWLRAFEHGETGRPVEGKWGGGGGGGGEERERKMDRESFIRKQPVGVDVRAEEGQERGQEKEGAGDCDIAEGRLASEAPSTASQEMLKTGEMEKTEDGLDDVLLEGATLMKQLDDNEAAAVASTLSQVNSVLSNALRHMLSSADGGGRTGGRGEGRDGGDGHRGEEWDGGIGHRDVEGQGDEHGENLGEVGGCGGSVPKDEEEGQIEEGRSSALEKYHMSAETEHMLAQSLEEGRQLLSRLPSAHARMLVRDLVRAKTPLSSALVAKVTHLSSAEVNSAAAESEILFDEGFAPSTEVRQMNENERPLSALTLQAWVRSSLDRARVARILEPPGERHQGAFRDRLSQLVHDFKALLTVLPAQETCSILRTLERSQTPIAHALSLPASQVVPGDVPAVMTPSVERVVLRLQAMFRGGRARSHIMQHLQLELRQLEGATQETIETNAIETVTGGQFGLKEEGEVDARSSDTHSAHEDVEADADLATLCDSFCPNAVLISGMTLTTAEGGKEPYNGINGRYRLSDQVLNFRPVYVKETGQAAMWWANVHGQLSWVIGEARQVGSDGIWAYSVSQDLSPHSVQGPWLVYSYLLQCYERQHDVQAREDGRAQTPFTPAPRTPLWAATPERTPVQTPDVSNRASKESTGAEQYTKATQPQSERRPGSALSGRNGKFVSRGPSAFETDASILSVVREREDQAMQLEATAAAETLEKRREEEEERAERVRMREVEPVLRTLINHLEEEEEVKTEERSRQRRPASGELAREEENSMQQVHRLEAHDKNEPANELPTTVPTPPLRPASSSRVVFSRPGTRDSARSRASSAARIAQLSRSLADARTPSRPSSSRQSGSSLGNFVTLESPTMKRARETRERDRVRKLYEDALEREERRLRELETNWLTADHTHFAHSHHFHHHPSQHHRPVTKPLQEYGVEQREKMIASYSKAASKGFKMADKAAQASARAEICALHAFSKGSKSEGASDIPCFPATGQSSHIHVSVRAVCNLPRRNERGTEGCGMPQPVVKASLVALTGDTPEETETETAGNMRSWLSPAASADILGDVYWDVRHGVVIKKPFVTRTGQGREPVAMIRLRILASQEAPMGDADVTTDAYQEAETVGECVLDIPASLGVGETRTLSRALVSRREYACAEDPFEEAGRWAGASSRHAAIKAVRRLVCVCFQDRVRDVECASRREQEKLEAQENQDEEMASQRAYARQQANRNLEEEDQDQSSGLISPSHLSSPASPLAGGEAAEPTTGDASSPRAKSSGLSLLQALGLVRKDPAEEARKHAVKLAREHRRSMAAAELVAAGEESAAQARAEAQAEAAKACRHDAEARWAQALSAAQDTALLASMLMLWRAVLQLKRCRLLARGRQVQEDLCASEPYCAERALLARRRAHQARTALAMVQAETQTCANPLPLPPSGKGHRRRQPRAEMAEMEADMGEKRQRAEHAVAEAEAAMVEAEARLLSARQRQGASTQTCEFAGSRVTIHLTGLVLDEKGDDAHDHPLAQVDDSLPPRIEDNGELTDVEVSKLKRDRVVPLSLGQLDVTVNFPSVLWRLPHFLPSRALARGALRGGGARGVVVRLAVSVVSAAHLPKMDTLGQIDPYVKLLYAQQEYATSVQASSYTPVWNESFTFDIATIPMTGATETAEALPGGDGEEQEGQEECSDVSSFADIAGFCSSCTRDVQIHVMDHDRVGAHDMVGSATISSATLLDRLLCRLAAAGGGRGGVGAGAGAGGNDENTGEEDVILFRKGQKVTGEDGECAIVRLRIGVQLLGMLDGKEAVSTADFNGGGEDGSTTVTRGAQFCEKEPDDEILPAPLMMKAFEIRVRDFSATAFLPQTGGSAAPTGYSGGVNVPHVCV